MHVLKTVVCILLFLCCSACLFAQQVPITGIHPAGREAQGVQLLTQVLNAAGGYELFVGFKDFMANGNITSFTTESGVSGNVTVRGRGITDFRMDAILPDGTHSWTVSGTTGFTRTAQGESRKIPSFNAISSGSLTMPFMGIANALTDSTVSIKVFDQEQLNGRTVYRIRTERNFGAQADPQGFISDWTTSDFLIDAITFLPVEIQSVTHPVETHLQGYLHEIIFSDYSSVNGILLPFSITEKIGNQTTWTIQLTSVALNVGLTDLDFQL